MYKIIDPPKIPTFYLPSHNDLNKITTQSIVKFIFNEDDHVERMWAQVYCIDGDNLICKLNNTPVFIKSIKNQDQFTAKKQQVINIY